VEEDAQRQHRPARGEQRATPHLCPSRAILSTRRLTRTARPCLFRYHPSPPALHIIRHSSRRHVGPQWLSVGLSSTLAR